MWQRNDRSNFYINYIQNWNFYAVGLFASLWRNRASLRQQEFNVEMTWKVFGGQYYGIYHALLKQRCKQDGLSINAQTLSDQFKFHLQKES